MKSILVFGSTGHAGKSSTETCTTNSHSSTKSSTMTCWRHRQVKPPLSSTLRHEKTFKHFSIPVPVHPYKPETAAPAGLSIPRTNSE